METHSLEYLYGYLQRGLTKYGRPTLDVGGTIHGLES